MNFVLRRLTKPRAFSEFLSLASQSANHSLLKKFSTDVIENQTNKNLALKTNNPYQFHYFHRKYEKLGLIDNENLINFIKSLENSQSLNETIFLLYKISEYMHGNEATIKPSFVLKLTDKLNYIKYELQNNHHEDLMIGTLALSLSRFQFAYD